MFSSKPLLPDSLTLAMVDRSLLDVVSAAVAGRGHASVAALANGLGADLEDQDGGGPDSAAILLSPRQVRSPSAGATAVAAAVNAQATSVHDLDDGARLAVGHPGAAIWPVALAVAEQVGADSHHVAEAVALGYDIAIRVAAARDKRQAPGHASGRWAGIGAAATAARLRRFTPAQLHAALCLAENLSPGLAAVDHSGFAGADLKEGIAWAAYLAVIACDLAAAGFTGYSGTFELDALYDGEHLQAGGLDNQIHGLYFKPYGCCRWIHGALDGLLSLLRENDIAAGDIATISVETFSKALTLENAAAPDNQIAAQFSLPFCLAAAALHGAESLLPIGPALLADRQVQALAARVTLSSAVDFEVRFPAEAGARIGLRLASGRELQRTVRRPLGEPDNPMSLAQRRQKFRALAQRSLGRQKSEQLLALTENWRRRPLAELLTALCDLGPLVPVPDLAQQTGLILQFGDMRRQFGQA